MENEHDQIANEMWNESVDIVVIGSGGAGLMAALCCTRQERKY